MAKVSNEDIAAARIGMLPIDFQQDLLKDAFALLKKHGFPTEGADVYGKEYERLMKALKKSLSSLRIRFADFPEENKMIVWSELVVKGYVVGKTQQKAIILRDPSDDEGDEYGAEDTADTE